MVLANGATAADPRLVVITGADGFIGHALCADMEREGRPHRAIVRKLAERARVGTVALGDLAIAPEERLISALDGASAVVHLAGRAHKVRSKGGETNDAYRAANVEATARLTRAAVVAGVRRMILISTVKVHGEESAAGRPFRADDPMNARDAYARSKVEAERVLAAACEGTALAPIVVRLPLTYGPGVKGNFLSLIDAVARRAPLPLGAIRNRRHLLYIGNLVHVLTRMLADSAPTVGSWIAADEEALSTPDLARRIARALQVDARMFPVPVPLLRIAAALSGRSAMIPRLAGSFEVDASPLTQKYGALPFTVDQGLAATARWWRGRHAI